MKILLFFIKITQQNKSASMIQFLSRLSKNYFKFSYQLKRANYKELATEDYNYFATVLPKHNILTDNEQLKPYNQCFRRLDIGHSKLLLMPTNTQQVSKILQYCNQKNLAVVPQGGNTGLVGGSVPVFDQIIINMQKMNKIHNFSEVSSVLNCQAGCVLQKLNQYLSTYGFQVPLDLGAKGSCLIGGNAATNAGGKYVVKYGSLRSHILGLQVVLASGKILDLRSQIHKDNTGYDLKQLFIASEGTIGIITNLNIHCQKVDQFRRIMVIKTRTYQNILKMLPVIKKTLGKQLNAMEYMDGHTFKMVDKYQKSNILEGVINQDHLLFIESTSHTLQDVVQKLENVEDAIISSSDNDFYKIWKVREDVAALARNQGKVLAYDISFDVKEWSNLVQNLRNTTKKLVLGYGHIGDGNIHINIIVQEGQRQNHDQSIFQQVTQKKGSISAEHGIGLHKPEYMHLQKSKQSLRLLKQIKNVFDPKGILNPYKVLPSD